MKFKKGLLFNKQINKHYSPKTKHSEDAQKIKDEDIVNYYKGRDDLLLKTATANFDVGFICGKTQALKDVFELLNKRIEIHRINFRNYHKEARKENFRKEYSENKAIGEMNIGDELEEIKSQLSYKKVGKE